MKVLSDTFWIRIHLVKHQALILKALISSSTSGTGSFFTLTFATSFGFFLVRVRGWYVPLMMLSCNNCSRLYASNRGVNKLLIQWIARICDMERIRKCYCFEVTIMELTFTQWMVFVRCSYQYIQWFIQMFPTGQTSETFLFICVLQIEVKHLN